MTKIKIEDLRVTLRGELQKRVFDYLIENGTGSVSIIANHLGSEMDPVYKVLQSFIKKGISTRSKKMNTYFYTLKKEVEI